MVLMLALVGALAVLVWLSDDEKRRARHLAAATQFTADGMSETMAMQRAGCGHWNLPWYQRMFLPYPTLPGDRATANAAWYDALVAYLGGRVRGEAMAYFVGIVIVCNLAVGWAPWWLRVLYFTWLAVGCGVKARYRRALPSTAIDIARWVAGAHLWPKCLASMDTSDDRGGS